MAVNLPDIQPLGLKQVNTGITPNDDQGDFFYVAFEKHNFNMQILSDTIAPKLVANRIYYVSPTGNDANSGLLSSVPFATTAKALQVISTLNANAKTITIKYLDGVYTEAINVRTEPNYLSPTNKTSIVFEGNTANPDAVTFNLNTTVGFSFHISNRARVEIKGIRFGLTDNAFTGEQQFIRCTSGAICYMNNCSFGQMSASAIIASHMYAKGARIFINGPYKIIGGARDHLNAYDGVIEVDNTSGIAYNVTVSNSPVFQAFINVKASSTVTLASQQITYTGATAGFDNNRDFDSRVNYNNNLPSGLTPGVINSVTVGPFYIKTPPSGENSVYAASTEWVRSYTDSRVSALEAALTALGSGLQDAINGLGVVPKGGIVAFGGSVSSPPAGFLNANGQAVSRSTYSALFGVIGTTHGAGNGSSTFNLPDMRGRTLVGAGTGTGLTTRNLGDWIGTETHILSPNEMPNHSHVVVDPGHNHVLVNVAHTHALYDPGHSHVLPGQTYDMDASEGSDGDGSAWSPLGNYTYPSGTGMAVYPTTTTNYNVASGAGISVAAAGGNLAHNNMQPSIVVNFIIKH